MNRLWPKLLKYGINANFNRSVKSDLKHLHRSNFPWNYGPRHLCLQSSYKTNIIINKYLCRYYQQATPSILDDQNSTTPTGDDAIKQFRLEHQIFVRSPNNEDIKNIFDFNELEMSENLREIMKKLNYMKPTPIQAQSLPILFSGHDLIGIAQTGSGKTLAYLLPAFSKFYSIHRDYWTNSNQQIKERLNPKVLILAPTRELAVQIFDVIKQFKIFKSICLYGGNDRKKQIHFLQHNNPLFLVSTPGRLKDLIDAKFVDLSEISYLVVDEADRMLDMGFEPQISYLIDKCPNLSERQTMMFSATWPEEVKSLVNKYLKPDHVFISIGGTKLVANHNIEQKIIVCDRHERYNHLEEIFQQHPNEKTLVFCNTKRDCDKIAYMIQKKFKIESSPLHGDMSQRQREFALSNFKVGNLKVLCATNVAARGLDIDEVNIVINYDFPDDIETYVHRIGRTGRKSNRGTAFSFFTDQSNSLLARKLIGILKESKNQVPEELENILAKNPRHNNISSGFIRKPRHNRPEQYSSPYYRPNNNSRY